MHINTQNGRLTWIWNFLHYCSLESILAFACYPYGCFHNKFVSNPQQISITVEKATAHLSSTGYRIISAHQLPNLLPKISLNPFLSAPIQIQVSIFNRNENIPFYFYSQTYLWFETNRRETHRVRKSAAKWKGAEEKRKKEKVNKCLSLLKLSFAKGKQGEIRTVATIGLVKKGCQITALDLFKVPQMRNLDVCIVLRKKKQ